MAVAGCPCGGGGHQLSRALPFCSARINDDAPAERLQIRWQTALRICEPLLSGRP